MNWQQIALQVTVLMVQAIGAPPFWGAPRVQIWQKPLSP
jgi:hypothetical protein